MFEYLLTHESVAECLNSLAADHDLRLFGGEWLADQSEEVLQGLDGVPPPIGSIIHSMVTQAVNACAFWGLSEVGSGVTMTLLCVCVWADLSTSLELATSLALTLSTSLSLSRLPHQVAPRHPKPFFKGTSTPHSRNGRWKMCLSISSPMRATPSPSA